MGSVNESHLAKLPSAATPSGLSPMKDLSAVYQHVPSSEHDMRDRHSVASHRQQWSQRTLTDGRSQVRHDAALTTVRACTWLRDEDAHRTAV